jgi:preprotein translocase subunit SecD
MRAVTPDECPSDSTAAAPTDVLSACDYGRTAIYTLGPQAMELDLTQVETLESPEPGSYEVRLTIRPASALTFAGYTAQQVGAQLAFVRGGLVVFAPKITEPIKSTVLQISGNMTAQQADEVAGLLREPA